MTRGTMILLALLALTSCTPAPRGTIRLASDALIHDAEQAPLHPMAAASRWNAPFEPFTLIGNVHYVGTDGVSAWLITSPKGHILIDGILAQSVPLIIAHIKTLGFDIRDVKYLLNSHAHIDHAGGLAGLQLASGAAVLASAQDRPYLEAGDIGFGPSGGMKFPPIHVDRIVADGDVVRLGGTALKAHMTPGHTPGCTSWSMTAKGTDGTERSILFHCSATVAGQSLVPETYPGMIANYRATFAKVRTMKADIFLANHDNFFDLHAKRERQIAGDPNAFVDPQELQRFNTAMEDAFEAELAKEKAVPAR